MSAGQQRGRRPDDSEELMEDLRAGLRMPRAPAEFTHRLHEAIDAGFLDPPVRRARWPYAVIGVALAAAASVALVLWTRPPDTPATDPATWQMRGADVPLAVEMGILAVSSDGESTSWIHAGDSVAQDAWLRFQLVSPPAVYLALYRADEGGRIDLFYRWPEDVETGDRVSRDGDVWYSLDGATGEQTFVCVASDQGLTDSQVVAAADGTLSGETRVQVKSIAIRVE